MTSRKTKSDGKPELGDGYTKIADELLDALCKVTLRCSESQVFHCIIRRTYGWNKKEDRISIGQFVKATGLSRRTVVYALQNLEAKNMIKVLRAQSEGSAKNLTNSVQIQKRYNKWVVQGKGVNYSNLLAHQQDKYSKSCKGSAKNGGGSARMGKIEGNSLHPLKDSSTRKTKESTLSVEDKKLLDDHFKKHEREKKLAPLKSVYNHWNHQDIIIHKKLTEKIKQKIRTHLQDNALEDIHQAIDNYNTALKGTDYFFHFKWPLIDFLDRGLRKFLNEAHPLENFQTPEAKERKEAPPPKPRPEFPKQLTCNFCNTTSTITHRNIQCPRCNELFYKLTSNGSYKQRFPAKEDLITCAKCQYSWSYKATGITKCPNCGTNNRKNGQTEPDVQHKKDGIFEYVSHTIMPYSDHLIKEAETEAKEIEALSAGLLRDVPPLTQSQKEALDG